jgi:hypothetical protein
MFHTAIVSAPRIMRRIRRGAGRLSLVPLTAMTLAGLTVFASTARAQDTRAESIAAQQAEKATALQSYQPDALEQKLDRLDGLLFVKRDVYSFIGSVYPGGGLAFGPGYRRRVAETGKFDTHAAWSWKNYKAAETALSLPRVAAGRLTVALQASWLDAPDMAFYGTGIDSRSGDRTGFSYTTKSAGISGRVQVAPHVAVGGGLDVVAADTRFLDASSVVAASFSRTAAAAQAINPTYRRTQAFAEVDTRTSPGYTRRGGLYRVDFTAHHQTNGDAFSFQRFDAEVRQFVPLLRENWVIALRGLASTTTAAAGQDVPYFLLPDLGGSHTLRGYSAWRFRDRNRLLVNAEYRWTAGPFVDMALFLDAGTAAARFRDLDSQTLKKSYGIGMSLHTPASTAIRIELARTSDGLGLGLSFSPSF